MRIIARSRLRDFWEDHPEAEQPLRSWYALAAKAEWRSSADVKETIRTADILSGGRVVFNIRGDRYRLIVKIHYNSQVIFIRFVGTHREYDQIDAESV